MHRIAWRGWADFGSDRLPVFHWCATHDGDNIPGPPEVATSFFSWDLAFAEVYDIPGVLAGLFDELTANLDLSNKPSSTPSPK